VEFFVGPCLTKRADDVVGNAGDAKPSSVCAELPAGHASATQTVFYLVVKPLHRAGFLAVPLENPTTVGFRAVGDDRVIVMLGPVGEELTLGLAQSKTDVAQRDDVLLL
jgi:hypothetical protein